MIVPILILSHNRPSMLKDMIESIELYTEPGTYRIIICDNNSTQPESITLLKELEEKYTVIRNNDNNTFEGLNPGLDIVKKNNDKFFIISDPDIQLTYKIPSNWISKMCEILNKTNYPKIGLALNTEHNFYPNWVKSNSDWIKHIRKVEKPYWEHKVNLNFIEDDCYEALVDTTMAMYRHDTYSYWKDNVLQFDREHGITGKGWIELGLYSPQYLDKTLRIAGRFVCNHMGWWMNPKHFVDFIFYLKNSRAYQIASSFQKNAMVALMESLPKDLINILLKEFKIKKIKQLIKE